MPPTGGGGGNPNPLANLANFESSTGHSTIQAVSGIVSGNGVDLLASSQARADSFGSEVALVCLGHSCVAFLSGDDINNLLTFNRTVVRDISLVSQTAYFTNGEYTSTSTSGVTVNGATLARGTLTGTRAEGTTPFEFQSFAGWLNGSIFGTTQIEFGASGSEQYRFISYLAGVPATNNPSASGSETSATWNGTTVASIKADRTFILGDATVTIPDFTNADVDVTLDNWRGLDNQAVSGMSAIIYRDLDLAGGSFVPNNANEQISGRFYGTGHTEVGGFFNTEAVTGAFGGTRQ